MKIAIALACIGVIAIGFVLYSQRQNVRVTQELRDSPDGERAHKVMLITLPSGKTLPVNYLRDPGFVYAGADFPWWRELRGSGAPVTLLVRGETLRGHARAIEDDPERRASVFARLRPTALSWAGTLVAVELEETTAR